MQGGHWCCAAVGASVELVIDLRACGTHLSSTYLIIAARYQNLTSGRCHHEFDQTTKKGEKRLSPDSMQSVQNVT
jgi:hypothetical protein